MTERKCDRCQQRVHELDSRKEGAMCFTLYDKHPNPQWWSISVSVTNANTEHDLHLCKRCMWELLEPKP